MEHFLYFVILIILVADFGLEQWLALLNIKSSKNKLPENLSDIYNAEAYAKQQKYFSVNSRFSFITSTFSIIVLLIMYLSGGFGWLDSLLIPYFDNDILRSLVFFGILFVANDLISIPFQWYHTFVIEQKFEFNKQTPLLFITDKLKSYLITFLIGGGLLYVIILLYNYTHQFFWILAFSVVTFFGLFMSMFYSQLIVPLFNKQSPLTDGELRNTIEEFAKNAGFKLNNIYVIDGSKRSTKANAYFTGFGPKKRIVLYDTLMDKLSNQEIVAVLAHEIGHNKFKHTVKNLLISLPSSLLLFYLLGLILQSDVLAQVLGGTTAIFHLNVLAFGILYTPVSLVLDLIGNQISRKFEYQADNYANNQGLGNELISGLKKLSATSLSNLMPHPIYVFFHYSHPTLYQRINNITNKLLQSS